VPWPDDIPVPPFREFCSPGAFVALLTGTGWAEAEVQELSWEHRVDPEAWWREVYLAGVSSNAMVIGRQDSATVARIKHEFDRLAARYAAGDGQVAWPAVALLASASR
jgi:hypothetical protein